MLKSNHTSLLLLVGLLAGLSGAPASGLERPDEEPHLIRQNLVAPNRMHQLRTRPDQRQAPAKAENWFARIQQQLVEQSIRQDVAQRDQGAIDKWLTDNINDLHRELRQAEQDFEHFAQVTKGLVEANERRIKSSLAALAAAGPQPPQGYLAAAAGLGPLLAPLPLQAGWLALSAADWAA